MQGYPGEERLAQVELSSLDRAFAKHLALLAPGAEPLVLLAAALASRRRGEGHICLDLRGVAGRPLVVAGADCMPGLGEWCALLRRSPLVGAAGEFRPLILEGERLYLQRFWQDEEEVAAFIRRAGEEPGAAVDEELLRAGLARLFPAGGEAVDWQRVAAIAAVYHRFCLISGGPGTGKTSTVARILALLLEQAGERGVRIILAGPTGKAAARLQEAMQAAKGKLDSPWAAAIPGAAVTVHRLLGSAGGGRFRYNRQQPLAAEVVVVDEASMVDLSLMAALFAALPAGGRLILLGDRDQLASVQPGAVLGDLSPPASGGRYSRLFRERVARLGGDCLSGAEGPPGLADALVELRSSYRFGATSGIGAVSRAVNGGRAEEALAAFRRPEFADLGWRRVTEGEAGTGLASLLVEEAAEHWARLRSAASPEEALAALGRFGVLCALRQGPHGAEAINEAVRRWLVRQGEIGERGTHYPGRPLMVTANDHANRLYNGDIGVVFPDPAAGGRLRVFFEDGRGGLRRVLPLRLPAHQSFYALTVHKSQGSEFDRVLFVLPETVGPVLSRELIYTALTRARHKVTVVGREEVFAAGVAAVSSRDSGLRGKIWPQG